MVKIKSLQFLVIPLTIFLIPTVSYSKDGTAVPDKTKIIAKAAKLQIPFIENQGQVKDKSVRFYANTFAGGVYVTEKGEIVYGLTKVESKGQGAKGEGLRAGDVAADFSLRKNVGRDPLSAPSKNVVSGVGAGSVPAHPSQNNVGQGLSLAKENNPEGFSYKGIALRETLIGAKEVKVKGER